MPYAFLDHPGPIPYAHRGGALEGLENTMPAFEAATAMGYRYLETDARVTADGVLLAFHDDDLSRTCGRTGKISELPWSEVQTARVDGKEPIPLMEDVLGTFPQCRINLDAKSDRAVAPLIDVIRRTASVERRLVPEPGPIDERRPLRVAVATDALERPLDQRRAVMLPAGPSHPAQPDVGASLELVEVLVGGQKRRPHEVVRAALETG